MFRGANTINLDGKGRISVPARYRAAIVDQAQSHLIITRSPFENCLLIFLPDEWKKADKKLKALANSEVNWSVKRVMQSNCNDVDMDASGRLLIPPALREKAGLTKEVVLVGVSGMFQLWDAQQWKQLEDKDEKILALAQQNPDELPDLGF